MPRIFDNIDQLLLPALRETLALADRALPQSFGSDEMLAVISSRNGVPIRLTDERWAHITEEDGFVITAFMTRRRGAQNRRRQIWP